MSYVEMVNNLSNQDKIRLATELTLCVMEHAPKLAEDLSDELALRLSINRTLAVFGDILKQLDSGSDFGTVPTIGEINEWMRNNPK